MAEVTRLLVRAHKSPFRTASPRKVLAKNLFGSNVGNLVFGQAAIRLLSTSTSTVKTSGLIKQAAHSVNSDFDHVVIPLANAFRPNYAESLDGLSTLIEKLKIPVTVMGVGAQASIEGEHSVRGERLTPTVQRFVRAVLERSPSIGVRGEFTRDYLIGLGFADDQIDVIGCPSMFMEGPTLVATRRVPELTPESRIALNISPYLREMGQASLDLAKRYPNLVYIPQDLRTLNLMVKGTFPMEKQRATVESGAPIYLDHPLIASDRIRFCLDPKVWFDHLATYDFSFGSRIHGNIAAVLAGTGAVVLAHDSRTLELASYHKIPHRLLPELDGWIDPIELHAEADWDPMHAAHLGLWKIFAAFLGRHRLRHVFSEGENPGAFNERLASTEFPPPVGTLMGMRPQELYAMKRELEKLRSHSVRPQVSSLKHRIRGLVGKIG
jgi:hypothetical protein